MDLIVHDNSLKTWLVAAVTAATLLAFLLLMRRVIAARLARFAAGTDSHLDDLILAVVRGTQAWFLTALALLAGARVLVLPGAGLQLIRTVTVFALIVQVALWGNVLIGRLVARHVERSRDTDGTSASTIGVLGFLARVGLWAFLLLLALDNLGVDITALVAGLGVGGVAVALAVQNILGDLFASLSIVLDKPFVKGDFIIVGEMLGNVEHIGLKTTRVRSLHGEQIVFSNADLLDSRIRNYKRMEERRILFSIGVTYDTPPGKLARIPQMVRSIIEALPQVRFDRAHFRSFGAFSLDFEIVYYVLDSDYARYMDLQHAINLAIVDRFAAEGIEFAYPTQTLHLNMAPAGPRPAAVTPAGRPQASDLTLGGPPHNIGV